MSTPVHFPTANDPCVHGGPRQTVAADVVHSLPIRLPSDNCAAISAVSHPVTATGTVTIYTTHR
jgi:hypothetical protein